MIRRIALGVLLLGLVSVAMPQTTLSALSGSEFNAGRIIDDAVFFRSQPTMSVGEIQTFLNAKVPSCDTWGTQPYGSTTRAAYAASKGIGTPFTCLKDYRENTAAGKPNQPGLCYGWGGGEMSAAQIIYYVSESCGINTKVLLVLLQKEQGLITDDWPWPVQYKTATGFGCPDTAACDTQYYGFFNQLYNAARQYKLYAKYPEDYNYAPKQTLYVKWHPDFDSGRRDTFGRIIWEDRCGGTNVYIQNQATAGLYNYTPYQPNPVALSNLSGSQDDGCSSYGNRNFWRYFRDWFGSTYSNDTDVAHPNGTLIHDDTGIYLVENNHRRFFTNPYVIDSYRYNWNRIKPATSGDLNLPLGPNLDRLAPGTLFTPASGGPVYVMDYDTDGSLKKRHLSAYAFQQLGYSAKEIVSIPNYITDPIPAFADILFTPQHPSGTIVIFYGIPTVFIVDNGTLRPIANELAFDSYNLRMSSIKGGTQYDSWLPRGTTLEARQGTLVLTSQGIVVIDYDAQGIMSRPVGPWECYADRLHFNWTDWVNNYQSLQIPTRTGPLFTC